jgi:hypothetical protein
MRLVHCSYHKCLTVYYSRVLSATLNRWRRLSGGYKHFNSLIREFDREGGQYRIASINNHALQWDSPAMRVSRFIRDPRDLVVSGYYYHKKGSEAWSRIVDPVARDFEVVNGRVPRGLRPGDSFASYLQSVSVEEGLIAEMEFRGPAFESMRGWPLSHPDMLVMKYEDVMKDERGSFEKLFDFYGFGSLLRRRGLRAVDKYSTRGGAAVTSHIRDPRPEQWREAFTQRATEYFESHYGDILGQYGYA